MKDWSKKIHLLDGLQTECGMDPVGYLILDTNRAKITKTWPGEAMCKKCIAAKKREEKAIVGNA